MSTLFFISLALSFVLLALVAALDLLGKSVPAALLGVALAAAGLALWRAIAERPKSSSQA
jgi:hypothetical protein